MSNAQFGLIGLSTVAVLALYWTLWKLRGELTGALEKLQSELSAIRKALEGKADKD